MAKLSCFFCPKADTRDKDLLDECSKCGRRYGFPLENPPDTIGAYRITKPLRRGFYAATYLAERGSLARKVVLKISPTLVMAHFHKDFDAECRKHSDVAQGTEHIVQIEDMFDAEVDFGTARLHCHVAELAYIEGPLLSDYLDGKVSLSAASATQIAIDLLRLLDELQKKRVHHNDLHSENIVIQQLTTATRRAGAVDNLIRAVAIDLGSLADGSKSDGEKQRHGDLRWIAVHVEKLWRVLSSDPDALSDTENRVANSLWLIGQTIAPKAPQHRTPNMEDLIRTVESEYYKQPKHWQPWRDAPVLKAYSASYNAQTMYPWHVPHLLVDPDDHWQNAISSPGPQVVTGMRGCGKTMLLRSLQFHARATQLENEDAAAVRDRITRDNYVGLFVSAQRLLDSLEAQPASDHEPFVRLFVAYALEAVRAVEHLSDIYPECVAARPYRALAEAVSTHVRGAESVGDATSEHDLEARLLRLALAVAQGDSSVRLTVHPSEAFPRLADALRQCGSVWNSAQVLFLLDDVSTRYLEMERIQDLLSALLFQDPKCAFKLTSEAQTVDPHLRSPGKIHPARIDRDLKLFDLGAQVYDKIKSSGQGNNYQFVAEILRHRAKRFAGHPRESPETLLGTVPLERIAREIVSSRETSGKRKEIYRGIRALAGMCVGDIGDVISLYEQILRASSGQGVPIPAKTQSECFQDFCARRLYDLNRRDGVLMNMAKSFAEAANTLLVQSGRGVAGEKRKERLRQYAAVYVRVTTGDKEKQMKRLRELVDAGVFVFAGGSSVPRSKTRDANPSQQFKLTYRKVYGLVNFIGLADRDRFELSGSDLEEWIAVPTNGKEILLRNLATAGGTEEGESKDRRSSEEGEGVSMRTQRLDNENESQSASPTMQGLLFGRTAAQSVETGETGGDFVSQRAPTVNVLGEAGPGKGKIEHAILGLGFEHRTRESVDRLCSDLAPQRALAIEYSERGHANEIRDVLRENEVAFDEMRYADALRHGLPKPTGPLVVDITGLAKPLIFEAVRSELRRMGRVWICHTEAETYYPRDVDLESILAALRERGRHGLLEALSGVLTGEKGPYECRRLLKSDADETRQRVLFAFATAKHERLLSLLDHRAYDELEIVVPDGESMRSEVAELVGEIAAMNHPTARRQRVGSNDLEGTLRHLGARYKALYVDGRQNFEVGLTGSKLQAVACAAASAAFKFSQGWYLQPREFDPQRFTEGVGTTKYYEVCLRRGT